MRKNGTWDLGLTSALLVALSALLWQTMMFAGTVVAAVGLVLAASPSADAAAKALKPITLTDAFFKEHK